MNRHRREKEEEELQNAQYLIEFKQQNFGGIPWPSYGGGGGGGSISSNASIVGTSMLPYLYPNQSSSALQSQFQMNQQVSLPQQTAYGVQGGQNFLPESYLSVLDNTPIHHCLPSQRDVTVTGQLQAQYGPWVNSGTDFHVQPQLNQAGPSQSLQEMASNNLQVQSSNVPMAPIMHQFPQQQNNVQFIDVTHINQPAYHFHVPQDYTQTSIDETSGSFEIQSGGSRSEQNQTT